MVEFYEHYVLPDSPCRSKLAIHLHAQATSEGVKQTSATGTSEKGIKTRSLKGINKGESPLVEDINTPPTVVIADLVEFRSKLQVSAGPQAVKHISEFEEQSSHAKPVVRNCMPHFSHLLLSLVCPRPSPW